MKALPLSGKASLLKPDYTVQLSNHNRTQTLTIKSVKSLPKFLVLSFHGICGKEEAGSYRDALVYIDDDAALDEGEYLVDQILGMDVFTNSGDFVGSVAEIFETKGNDVYVIRNGEKEYLLPAVKEFIIKIDLSEKKIVIQEMEGLLD